MYSPHVSPIIVTPGDYSGADGGLTPILHVGPEEDPLDRYQHGRSRPKSKAHGAEAEPDDNTVAAWMQTSVISVQGSQTLGELAELLSLHHISGVPVVDAQGQLAGVVSQSDLARFLAQVQHEHIPSMGYYRGLLDQALFADPDLRQLLKDGTVADILTPYPFWVAPEASVKEVVDLMLEHHIHRVPVIEDGRLVGVLSTMDVLRILRKRL